MGTGGEDGQQPDPEVGYSFNMNSLPTVKIAILDRQKYLVEDFSVTLDPDSYKVCGVYSGLELLEKVAGPGLNGIEPQCDIVVIPHEIESNEGAQACHILRRLYDAKKLIILVLIPPFVDESVTHDYLAAEVNEICVFPISRIAISSKFSLFSDLVQAQRRSQNLSEFEVGIGRIDGEKEKAIAIVRSLQPDNVIQSVYLEKMMPTKGRRKSIDIAGRVCRLLLKSYAIVIRANKKFGTDDITYFKAFLNAAKRNQSNKLHMSAIEGLNLVKDQQSEICGIKGANQYSEIIYQSGSRHLVRNTPLKMIQRHFKQDFTRCHKSWLVSNTLPWRSLHKGRGRYVIAAKSLLVPVGDRFLPEIRRSQPDWFAS
jgi:CheY-like chemotaxis protein